MHGTVSTADDPPYTAVGRIVPSQRYLDGPRVSYGSINFGPVVDPTPYSSVPDLPPRLPANGLFHNVSGMVGHNSNQGLLFTPLFVQDHEEFGAAISTLFPTANESVFTATLPDELYPPAYSDIEHQFACSPDTWAWRAYHWSGGDGGALEVLGSSGVLQSGRLVLNVTKHNRDAKDSIFN
ncbi:prolyl oligopeptidase-like protein [Diplocarpon rosae]|nr:prolyl oligopeptidase-like protein [Diplocarpon rosae]